MKSWPGSRFQDIGLAARRDRQRVAELDGHARAAVVSHADEINRFAYHKAADGIARHGRAVDFQRAAGARKHHCRRTQRSPGAQIQVAARDGRAVGGTARFHALEAAAVNGRVFRRTAGIDMDETPADLGVDRQAQHILLGRRSVQWQRLCRRPR